MEIYLDWNGTHHVNINYRQRQISEFQILKFKNFTIFLISYISFQRIMIKSNDHQTLLNFNDKDTNVNIQSKTT